MQSAKNNKKIIFLIVIATIFTSFLGCLVFFNNQSSISFGEINSSNLLFENEEFSTSELEPASLDASFSLSATEAEINFGSTTSFTYQSTVAGEFKITSNNEGVANIIYSPHVVGLNDYTAQIKTKSIGSAIFTIEFTPSNQEYVTPNAQTFELTVNQTTLNTPTNIQIVDLVDGKPGYINWDEVVLNGINVSYSIDMYIVDGSEKNYYSNVASTTINSLNLSEVLETIKNNKLNAEVIFSVQAISDKQECALNSAVSFISIENKIRLLSYSFEKEEHISSILVDNKEESIITMILGQIVEISATTSDNYVFHMWNTSTWASIKNSFSSSTELTAGGHNGGKITATAAPRMCDISIVVNNDNFGTVDEHSFKIPYLNPVEVNGDLLTIYQETEGAIVYNTCTATPTQANQEYSYFFDGWSNIPSDGIILDDIVIIANFSRRLNLYTINFVVDEESQGFGEMSLNSISANYGEEVSFKNNVISIGDDVVTAIPTEESNQYVYTFDFWEGKIEIVEGNVAINAHFKRELNKHKVTIVVNPETYGNVDITEVTAEYGTNISFENAVLTIGNETIYAEASEKTAEYTYSFKNWTGIPEDNLLSEPITITANFERNPNSYKLTLDPNEGQVDPAEIVVTYSETYGELPTPVKTGYDFVGWYTERENGSKIVADTLVTIASEHTLYAHWDLASFKITFSSNYDGGAILAQSFKYGATIVFPQTERTGYTFDAWYNEPECSTPFELETMPAQDLTIYANWIINQYTITFETNGGSLIDPITQDYATHVEAPNNPTKDGYTFAGWYTDNNTFNNQFEFKVDTIMPVNGLTLYANWTINNYKLTYNYNYLGIENNVENYDYATTIVLQTPVRDGYNFDGWFNEKECLTEFEHITMPAQDLTIYAKWTINSYTLTYHFQYDDENNEEIVKTETYNYQEEITLIQPTRDGYVLIGWFKEDSCVTLFNLTNMPSRNVEVYAKWVIQSYLLTYNLNYENAPQNIVQNYDYLDDIELPDDPEREGYTFGGWFEDKDCTNKAVLTVMPANDVKVYAKWTINSYKLTYVLNYENVENVEETYQYASTISLINPTRTGYDFKGWYKEAECLNEFDLTTMPANDVTVYAKWEKMKFTITATSGENGTISPNGESIKEYGESITYTFEPEVGYHVASIKVDNVSLMDNEFNNAVLNGYTFENITKDYTIHIEFAIDTFEITATSSENGKINPVGIIEKDYGSEQTFTFEPNIGYHVEVVIVNGVNLEAMELESAITNGYTFTDIQDNHTIHVEFAQTSFTFTFDLNYEDKKDVYYYHYLDVVSVPEHVREGHTFKGWFEDKDCTKPATITTMPANNVIVYAFWNINQYSITYNYNDGVTAQKVVNYDFNKDIEEEIPTREGYAFGGWWYENDQQFLDTKMPAKDVVVFARWLANAVKLILDWNYDGYTTEKVFNVDSQVVISDTRDREGYTFGGWYFDQDCLDAFDYIMPSIDTIIYAKWTINQYTITFETNGGTQVSSITQDYATAIEIPADPTKEGHTFAGWFRDNNTFKNQFMFDSNTTMPAENLTLYANWTIDQYTITFETNGGSTISPKTQNFGTLLIKPADPTKDGYTFDGWFKDNGTFENQFEFDTNPTMPVGGLTLYAKWEINQYTITFETNGGTQVNSITQDYATYVEAPNNPTKDGYTFDGWYTDNNTFKNQFVFDSNTTMPAEDIALFAKWDINSYVLTYNLNYNELTYTTQTYEYMEIITKPEDPTRTGYNFKGWFEEEDCIVPFTIKNMPSYDKFVYAKWEKMKFTITATTDGNGTIYPSGEIETEYGENQLFTFTPSEGHYVSSIKINDVELEGEEFINAVLNGYSFENVTDNHTILVSFEISTFTINATTNSFGTISPNGLKLYGYGDSVTYKITPSEGYSIYSITVDGEILTDVDYEDIIISGYTFENIKENHTIHVEFNINEFIIVATSEGNGTITPSGTIEVPYGDNKRFTFIPEVGSNVSAIIVDGVSLTGEALVGAINNGYNFSNITTSHTIHVVFKLKQYSITFNVEGDGTFSCYQDINKVDYGDNRVFSIDTDFDKYSVEVFVNGVKVNSVGKELRINNVQSNIHIEVKFIKKSFFETQMGLITIIIIVVSVVVTFGMVIVIARVRRKRRTRLI